MTGSLVWKGFKQVSKHKQGHKLKSSDCKTGCSPVEQPSCEATHFEFYCNCELNLLLFSSLSPFSPSSPSSPNPFLSSSSRPPLHLPFSSFSLPPSFPVNPPPPHPLSSFFYLFPSLFPLLSPPLLLLSFSPFRPPLRQETFMTRTYMCVNVQPIISHTFVLKHLLFDLTI